MSHLAEVADIVQTTEAFLVEIVDNHLEQVVGRLLRTVAAVAGTGAAEVLVGNLEAS